MLASIEEMLEERSDEKMEAIMPGKRDTGER